MLKKETSEMLINIRGTLCERSEKLAREMTSFSNCTRVKDRDSEEFKAWQAEYNASCKEKFQQIDEISREVDCIDEILRNREQV